MVDRRRTRPHFVLSWLFPYEGISQGDPNDTSVCVIGDSLLWWAETAGQSRTSLVSEGIAQASHYADTVNAVVGLSVDEAENTYDLMNGRTPDILIVALGTNDLHDTNSPDQALVDAAGVILASWAAQATTAFRFVMPEDTTVWGIDTWWDAWDTMVQGVAAGHADGDVIYQSGIETLPSDVHHTERGRAQYRDLILSALP